MPVVETIEPRRFDRICPVDLTYLIISISSLSGCYDPDAMLTIPRSERLCHLPFRSHLSHLDRARSLRRWLH